MTPERLAKLKSALARRQPDLTVYMDAVNKSHNVSAIVRTADAVGIHRLDLVTRFGPHILERRRLAGGQAPSQAFFVLRHELELRRLISRFHAQRDLRERLVVRRVDGKLE